MGGPPYDFLANPLGVVRSTFDKAISSPASDPASFDGKDWGALDPFRHFLFEQDHISQVPILNPESIKWVQPNTLVRFRGMIQDMLGHEFYTGVYKDGHVWKTNKFSDGDQLPMDSSTSSSRLWERQLMYCVPVPGLNSWTESRSEAATTVSMDGMSQQGEKRQRMDVDSTDSMVSCDEFQDSPNAKRMREDGNASISPQSEDNKTKGSCSTVLPDVDRHSLDCLVKVYDCAECELRLNGVFEFVGVLAYDVDLPFEKDEFDDDFCRPFVPNKAPRLHCIIHRKLEMFDFLSRPLMMEPKPDLIKSARQALMGHLTTLLGNDGLAAEYMMLHLLSKIISRRENVAVGKLSLNLTGLRKESMGVFGPPLQNFLESLLPFTRCIPLSLEYLNTVPLAPRKDYETNRLDSGALQLAEGSQLIIDETQLETGTLNPVGVENARILKELAEIQKVEYDFKYYKMEMTVDIRLLVLSDGKSNLMPADIVLPFQPTAALNAVVSAEALQVWRWYLSTVRSLEHYIDPSMEAVVSNDLVAARQADPSINCDNFNSWLTMGRLIAVSFGECCLGAEQWQMVMELERMRRKRLK